MSNIVHVSFTTKPTRIQLRRTSGFKLPTNTVIVTRGPGKIFGNPFSISPELLEYCNGDKIQAQKACVDAFRDWLHESAAGSELKESIRAKLRGKNLACWCKPGTPCHADVLIEVANHK